MKHDVVNLAKKNVGQVDLSDAVFASEVKVHLIHEAVKAQLANKRLGTASTKTRSDVSGSGVKPYKQKGTGRARHGSYTSPLFVGGGITFGPKPRDYSLKLSKNKRKAALKAALSAKVKESKLLIIDKWDEKEKTKEMAKIFKALEIDNALIVIGEKTDWLMRTVRNLKGIGVVYASMLTAYNVVAYDYLVCTKDVVAQIQEGFKK